MNIDLLLVEVKKKKEKGNPISNQSIFKNTNSTSAAAAAAA